MSVDQFVSRTLGKLTSRIGKCSNKLSYAGGTIFVDHATGLAFVCHQMSLHSGDMVQAKHKFEEFARQHGMRIQGCHADNHLFGSAEFLADIELQGQTMTYSGVGAHHQNGVSIGNINERCHRSLQHW